MQPCSSKTSTYILATSVAILAICLSLWVTHRHQIDIEAVLSGLHRLEASYKPFPQPNPGPLVMVGFGGCTDITVNALTFFEGLGVDPNATVERRSQTHDELVELNSLEDVIEEFTKMFISGAAAERYVKNQTLFKLLVDHATTSVENPNKMHDTATRGHLSLGGNAPVMATRMAREGAEVTLVARLSSREIGALPPSVRVISAPPSFGLPDTPESDIHLVLEYDRGAVWRNHTAPRANRYILIRDEENPRMSSLWPNLMTKWKAEGNHGGVKLEENAYPDLFVLGGLQTMDNAMISPDVRPQRIEQLKEFLSLQLPQPTLVHFEMASFVETNFIVNLTTSILPYVDSIGLNEQELPNLLSLLAEGRVAPHASLSTPRAAVMLDAMREIWYLLTDTASLPRVGSNLRRLSRIHLHTLGYQVIMVRRPKDPVKARLTEERAKAAGMHFSPSEAGRAWPFARAAAAKASLIAHRHTCATASIDPELTRLLMDDSFAVTADPERWSSALLSDKSIRRIQFNATAPVSCWHEEEPAVKLNSRREFYQSGGQTIETHVEICVAPVPVCRKVTRTVGGGDNISAGALRSQLVERKRG